MDKNTADERKCVLCGADLLELFPGSGLYEGNNPAPLASLDDGECCDYCNSTAVAARWRNEKQDVVLANPN